MKIFSVIAGSPQRCGPAVRLQEQKVEGGVRPRPGYARTRRAVHTAQVSTKKQKF